MNPENMKHNSYSKTFSIDIMDENGDQCTIALIGDYHSFDSDCALLKENILTVIQNNTITQIDLDSRIMLKHKTFKCFGCCFAIYVFEEGYIVYGEMEVLKLNEYFEIEWSFSGSDIFVTLDTHQPFKIDGSKIKLYDWNGIYYEIDSKGKLIN